jgi:RNA polymerase sigma factor (sigma-70 family)
MFDFDPDKPPEKVLVTKGGVQIIVRAPPPPPPPEPPPSSKPPEPLYPRAIVVPANASAEYLDALFTRLCALHRDFVLQVLLSRGDVLAESAKDLAQNVLVDLWKYVRENRSLKNVRGFLVDLVDKEVVDHKRWMGRRPPLDREADPEAASDHAPDPEQAVDDVQHMAKVQRCMASLPHREAEAVRYIELLEETLEKTAKAVKRPLSTVAAQHDRGMARLKELANAPEEAPPAAGISPPAPADAAAPARAGRCP